MMGPACIHLGGGEGGGSGYVEPAVVFHHEVERVLLTVGEEPHLRLELSEQRRSEGADAVAATWQPLRDEASVPAGHHVGAHRATGDESLDPHGRSEEHTSELQSLMRISYAVFCL